MFAITQSFGISPSVFKYAYGQWDVVGDRLVQSDLEAGMARVDIPYPQNGIAMYQFNVQYKNGGAEDGHAGFGIHIFVDKPAPGKAWGNGESYLLWLNYDENAKGVTKGLSAQVYKSLNNSQMDLVADFDLNKYAPMITEANANLVLPIKMTVNGITGDVKVYDPTDPGYVYTFNLGNKNPIKGNYVSLRTNSGSFSFGQ
ncbi:MAG: hypothetical protein PF518_01110 [Spirochaetaceae bacterium]|nr:hypothetical protein [Spirochaetaceae bacterium]